MTLSRATAEGTHPRRRANAARALAAAIALASALAGCDSGTEPAPDIPVGVLLSYTGALAAGSINSERALRMAVEAGNAVGGVNGRPVRLVAKDTGSDYRKVVARANELLDGGVALVIGPDTAEQVIAARGPLQNRTIILPSFATSSDVLYRVPSWFVIGASIGRMACELNAQLQADGRQHPVVIYNSTGYSASMAWTLTNQFGLPRVLVPTNEAPSSDDIRDVASTHADAYVLATFPSSGVSLVYTLLANGVLDDPTRWYLGPTLHSPVFLDLLPKGGMVGARGVSQGAPDAADFRAAFAARWQDAPLDDAYPFYDAGALTVLSLQRALAEDGAIPGGAGLSKHIIEVTRAGGAPVHWNELAAGLEHLRKRERITYVGLSGRLEFDALGTTPGASTRWWTIGPQGFTEREPTSACR